jgi:hypothetical protein
MVYATSGAARHYCWSLCGSAMAPAIGWLGRSVHKQDVKFRSTLFQKVLVPFLVSRRLGSVRTAFVCCVFRTHCEWYSRAKLWSIEDYILGPSRILAVVSPDDLKANASPWTSGSRGGEKDSWFSVR